MTTLQLVQYAKVLHQIGKDASDLLVRDPSEDELRDFVGRVASVLYENHAPTATLLRDECGVSE